MIDVDLKIDRQSTVRVQRALARLQAISADTRQANHRVGIWALRWINDNFQTEGGKVGKWAPFKLGGRLNRETRVIDRKAKLLADKGRLKASFDSKPRKDGVTIGSDVTYSKYHEEGVPQRNLPQRRMLMIGDEPEVERAILYIYDSYFYREFTRL